MKVKYFILFIFFTKVFAVTPVIPVIDVRQVQKDLLNEIQEKKILAKYSINLSRLYEKLQTIQNVYEQVEILAKIEEDCENIINETRDMGIEKREKIKELLSSTQKSLGDSFTKILHSDTSFKGKVDDINKMLTVLTGNTKEAGLVLQEAALEASTEIQKSLTQLQLLGAAIYKKNDLEKKINEQNNNATFKGIEKIGL